MKCEKCGNEYLSQSYFATPTICNDCFNKLSEEEKQQLMSQAYNYYPIDQYAYRIGFGRRLGAYLIDWAFVNLLFVIAFFATGLYDEFKGYFYDLSDLMKFFQDPGLMQEFTNSILPITFILTFMYYSLEIVLAATPGKIILGIQIANQDRTQATIITLFTRFVLKHSNSIFSLLAFVIAVKAFDFVGSLLGLAFIVGCFFVLASKRQGFHDMIAKTAVFRKKEVLDRNNVAINDNSL
ncbi:MAG: RDD family protein [Ignavibacteriae bacterium]|nr:RDD family protein [Ignavibacteriota bacterium]